MKSYIGFIPPCGVYCGTCPNYLREKNPCPGAEKHCRARKCKGIYVCCTEKRGLSYCYECSIFPCSRYRKFAESWKVYGQDIIENQQRLKELGAEKWLGEHNKKRK